MNDTFSKDAWAQLKAINSSSQQQKADDNAAATRPRQIKVPMISHIADRKSSFFRGYEPNTIYNDARYSQEFSNSGMNATVKSLQQHELKKLI